MTDFVELSQVYFSKVSAFYLASMYLKHRFSNFRLHKNQLYSSLKMQIPSHHTQRIFSCIWDENLNFNKQTP